MESTDRALVYIPIQTLCVCSRKSKYKSVPGLRPGSIVCLRYLQVSINKHKSCSGSGSVLPVHRLIAQPNPRVINKVTRLSFAHCYARAGRKPEQSRIPIHFCGESTFCCFRCKMTAAALSAVRAGREDLFIYGQFENGPKVKAEGRGKKA